MLGVKTADINASACATAPLGPVIGLVGAGATGVEGDKFPLVQQIFRDVHVPSQDLSQNVNIVAFRPYLSHLCPA